ncbi:flavin-nucleotide-binding protein [Cenarchaeum symbiosum A]|uniref:Flavin-nucleotide-binding protein n=1 Tax=Cenarchaeum symbiosum (strain A) TaxID=414004 RepID=A0RV13_CENSY|nr:flavin-nucleotide-binding protein [Cenarchaeum symbiosum A]
MQLLGRLEIRSEERIIEFLGEEHVGRISTVDADGYPQVIPMNFVYMKDAVYMHSHVKGEKLDNIRRDSRAGFEVDREVEFLPSYFEDPHDASVADTLYVSVVIKGRAELIDDTAEKAAALNGLMAKYQPEGRYDPVKPGDEVLGHLEIIKVVPHSMRGKYKIGQHLDTKERAELAAKILDRGSDTAASALKIMGFEVVDGRPVMRDEPSW